MKKLAQIYCNIVTVFFLLNAHAGIKSKSEIMKKEKQRQSKVDRLNTVQLPKAQWKVPPKELQDNDDIKSSYPYIEGP